MQGQKSLKNTKISSVTVHALPVPVVRCNDRKRLVASSARNVVRYPHSQNLDAVDTLISENMIQLNQ